jgi:hypothetical protein
METKTSKLKTALIRKFHALCYKNGIDAENKKVIIAGYGVDSTSELTEAQLIELCNRLEGVAPKTNEQDACRKRVMAVIGAWLRSNGLAEGDDAIKAVACRAAKAKTKDFNKLSTAALNRVYNEFRLKNETAAEVAKMKNELITKQINCN